MEEQNQYLSPKEVATRLSVTPKAIYLWLSQGRLKGKKIGNKLVRISASEVSRFMSESN